MEPAQTPHGKIGLEFATALANREFDRAFNLLTPVLRRELGPKQLATKYNRMLRIYQDGFSEANHVEVIDVMDDWPTKEDTDVGWAYVAINGPFARGAWCEAVTVIVSDTDEGLRVRNIEWGRP